jgi:hypothetical protein
LVASQFIIFLGVIRINSSIRLVRPVTRRGKKNGQCKTNATSRRVRVTTAAELFHGDGQTDMTKLVVPFSNFANAPKKCIHVVGKRAGKGCLKDLSTDGEIILKTIVLKIVYWIHLAQINDQLPSVANMLMYFRSCIKCDEFVD